MKSSTLKQPVIIDTIGTNVDGGLRRWIGDAFAQVRKGFEERAMIRELSSLDDALLRDIGIADDEIYRVRRLEAFTPRAWR